MQITITDPIQVKLPDQFIVPLLLGYVYLGKVPPEISKAVDELPNEAIPPGCTMIVDMWRNRGDEAEVIDLIRHMTNGVTS
jgi:hypothetical protein